MFLDALLSRNERLVASAAKLAMEGSIPANTFVLDLDAIAANGEAIRSASSQYGLSIYWMLKQVGRNPLVAQALVRPGTRETVSVDMACADALMTNGFGLGHVGNLVQIANADLPRVLRGDPEVVSTFSVRKAEQIAAVARELGREQAILLRVADPTVDNYLPGMEGGILLEELSAAAKQIQGIEGVRIAGVTSFPTMSYAAAGQPQSTGNFSTIMRARDVLERVGVDVQQVNAPGNTCALTVPMQAAGGATHIEPGHGFLGTTPYHLQFDDLPEVPAACYVSEVAHHFGGRAYIYGGGFFVDDPVWLEPNFRRAALVGTTVDELLEHREPFLGSGAGDGEGFGGIDYYGFLDANEERAPIGATVVMGFRMQSFVTRSQIAVIDHLDGEPRLLGIFDQLGRRLPWHE
ncbi:MAG: amino acid racemase-like protein [Aeromicrobium sp.]|jgi:predicted amino acid racemase|nr:amino acid racemase-like protein [Aeromicrobium sp.]